MKKSKIELDVIPLIKYNGSIHIGGYAYMTSCELSYPMHGKHLSSRKLGRIEEVTCEKCLNMLRVGGNK